MNRSELVRTVAERVGSEESVARRHVDAVFDTVMERVSAGERVIVTGFGTFDRLSRPARSARNPRTGRPVAVPAAQVPRFRSGQTFRNRVAASSPAPAAVEEAAAVEAVVGEAVAAPAPKKRKGEEVAPAPKKRKDGKKAKKNAAAKKPSGKPKAAASPPAKDAKRPKGGKKKAAKAKAKAAGSAR